MLIAHPSGAYADASEDNRMIAEYFRTETAALADKCLKDINTLEDWKAKRPIYRKQLLEMLALDPMPPKTDLKAKITGTVQHDEFTVENIHFQSMPGMYVTGNLYIPKNLDKPAPTILYVCGHGPVKIDGVSYGNKVSYQHHGAWFARHGYVCLAIDTVQMGEIEGIHHGTYRYDMWWWNSRGYSSAGIEAFNCIRALDYLQMRKEVDPDRIGVTGRSGGGAYSWWIAAIDDRIKVAVPVAGITDLENHVVDGCVEGHCDCMYFVNTWQWDYPLVAALVAPRPLLISNTDKDKIFPLDGVVRIHSKVRDIYRLYDADKNLGLHITEGPHKDTQELRTHAFVWFNRFLKGETPPIDKPAEKFFEPQQLKVFETLPDDSINAKIQETFAKKAPPPQIPESAEAWQAQTAQWMTDLKQKSFRGWPDEEDIPPLSPKKGFAHEHDGIVLAGYDFDSQENIRLRMYVAHKAGLKKPDGVTLRIMDQQQAEEFYQTFGPAFAPEFKGVEQTPSARKALVLIKKKLKIQNHAIVYVAPRGIGPTQWNSDKRNQIQIRRRFMLLGQTLDGMRVWDVRRAIRALSQIDPVNDSQIQIRAEGTTAGIALYASLFEQNISACTLTDPPTSHADGPIFLNVMRYLDMPQAVAIAAQRCPITIYTDDKDKWQYPLNVAEKLNWPKNCIKIEKTHPDTAR
jgi:cephalosporin-C deacetylase-like acetyl esterase